MTRNQKLLLMAIAAGDGNIHKSHNSKSCSLRFKHSLKQREYAEFKAALVNSIAGGFQAQVKPVDNSGYPGVEYAKAFNYARILRRRLYCSGAKDLRGILCQLTPQGLAIIYMDDGGLSLKKRGGRIHARELFLNLHGNKEYVTALADDLHAAFDVQFTSVKNKGSYRLRCGTIEAIKFLSIVSPFILPCFSYKLDMGYGDERDALVFRKSAQISKET